MNPNLADQLKHIGLRALPAALDDFVARATKARWSPRQMLEQMAQAEIVEQARRSLERRLRFSGIKSFKPMADFEWDWPTKIERDIIERALTLDFLPEGRNLVLLGTNGLGKTMIAKNICHAAVLAGSSVLFRTAPALLEDLQRQGPEGRRHKLSMYAHAGLLCIDEFGYLSFDDKAADLLYDSSNNAPECSISVLLGGELKSFRGLLRIEKIHSPESASVPPPPYPSGRVPLQPPSDESVGRTWSVRRNACPLPRTI